MKAAIIVGCVVVSVQCAAPRAHAQSVSELGLSHCREISIIAQMCLTASGKPMKVIWNGNGLDALDDGEKLGVNRIGPGEPRVFKYSYTPPGQLPTCDAAEMIYWLVSGTRWAMGAVSPPTLIGTIQGKNLCSAYVAGRHVTYSIELMDDGRWWVHR
jgi:hypothetical protein